MDATRTPNRLTWRKRLVFGSLMLALTLAVLEGLAYASYRLIFAEPFARAAEMQRMADIGAEPGPSDAVQVGIRVPYNVELHPYLGFGNPSGFEFLRHPMPEQTDPDTALVGLTGGSVSYNLFGSSRDVLEKALEDSGAFGARKVRVVLLGFLAWKQPQQLQAVALYFAMGGRLDALINLDGHNEVFDTHFNRDHGVFFAYPWLWYHLSANAVAPETMRFIGRLSFLRDVRRALARAAWPLRHSVTATVLWRLTDDALMQRADGISAELAEFERPRAGGLPFYRGGPRRRFNSDAELLAASVKVWADSSVQLARLARANGAQYVHFLQPNQYVPHSKPFSPDELRFAYHPPTPSIETGYPLLLQRGAELRKAGVAFESLTQVYEHVTETLYIDACCHVNKRGGDLLALAMAERLAALRKAAAAH